MKSDLFDLLTNARKETILNDNEKRSKILSLEEGEGQKKIFFSAPPGEE